MPGCVLCVSIDLKSIQKYSNICLMVIEVTGSSTSNGSYILFSSLSFQARTACGVSVKNSEITSK